LGFDFGVSQPPKSRRFGPPYNPDVRELIADKRRWSSRPKSNDARRGFRGWHERGYLPHRDEPGLTQFVTFHLADSFPGALRSEWEHLLELEDRLEQRKQIEAYLDRGRGACHLRRFGIAKIVEDSFRLFHSIRYELRAWVIMPNHIHVLFKVGTVPMSDIVREWKKHTGRLANAMLKRHGAFWAEDYFDIFMRDSEHERKTVHYIESNPAKARLVLDPRTWPRSSARFRDQFEWLSL
jgi:REP element-mobilizing transposase RayT